MGIICIRHEEGNIGGVLSLCIDGSSQENV